MIDLHAHTSASDGVLSPEGLVRFAKKNGFLAIAITDHDTVEGLEEAEKVSKECKQLIVPGLEMSVDCAHGTMHIIGLGIDYKNSRLRERLSFLAESRKERIYRIFEKLNSLGIKVEFQEVFKKVRGVMGRPHIAQVMVEKGYVRDINEAFSRFLGDGKPAYAKRKKFFSSEVIEIIHNSSGIAILAHPYTLNFLGEELKCELTKLKSFGLDGVEGYYSKQPEAISILVRKHAEEIGLLISGGSDFHGDSMPDIHLGYANNREQIPDQIWSSISKRIKHVFA